ncbi:hypothetical protein [Rivibacter subsaxonicus]|uniref:Uncharacterized protein n=1 Tax=Rivibacter subsaxonicus TaxID=457575 RepID=A0A4Q7VDR2_9BURK|nr:hypothetical protein [Rivibacter subsaxonicus]RZT93593.1 hypothetical protein EV670_3143 [Rivibacter subsaxonicus]
MSAAPAHDRLALRLMLARAVAWALLLTGWLGLGSLAWVLAPGPLGAFALVALWLLALGLAATVATRDTLPAWTRRVALSLCAALAAAALAWTTRGGGVPALLVALMAWAGLTALASGVVRSLRLAGTVRPGPPIAAASLGALCAGLVLGDLGDLPALALRSAAFVLAAAVALIALQGGEAARATASRCRAGLFDCSLPAWPAGAWHDARQWPTLLAGLAMLPMMASLPLMVAWCRAEAIAPQSMVLLHLAAMFVPALLLRSWIARWSSRTLSAVCAASLATGAIAAIWLPGPWNLLGLAAAHGAAWSLAWAGQLWAPDRRGRQGTSPLRAAIGYAALTLAFGAVVASFGSAGVPATQAALGLAAALAWLFGTLRPASPAAAVPDLSDVRTEGRASGR